MAGRSAAPALIGVAPETQASAVSTWEGVALPLLRQNTVDRGRGNLIRRDHLACSEEPALGRGAVYSKVNLIS